MYPNQSRQMSVDDSSFSLPAHQKSEDQIHWRCNAIKLGANFKIKLVTKAQFIKDALALTPMDLR